MQAPIGMSRSWTELNLALWEGNLRRMAQYGGGDIARVIPVIKANAYGHGVHLLPLPLLEQTHGVAVVVPTEANQLRNWGFLEESTCSAPVFPKKFPPPPPVTSSRSFLA